MTGRGLRCVTARCAAAAILLHGGTVLADPYQYDLRSRFIREVDEKERPPGLDLQPRIDSALLFVGNINLAENSADEVDVAGIEAAPGLYATYRSNRADASLDYSLIGRAFEDEDYDSVSHLLSAHGRYMLVQDLFFVHAQAGYSDSIIDASRSTNYGGTGLFNRSNIEETGRASITPSLTHQFGGFQFDASYTYGRVWYFESDDVANADPIFLAGFNEDSEDQRAYVSLGTRDPDNAATLKAFYEWQELHLRDEPAVQLRADRARYVVAADADPAPGRRRRRSRAISRKTRRTADSTPNSGMRASDGSRIAEPISTPATASASSATATAWRRAATAGGSRSGRRIARTPRSRRAASASISIPTISRCYPRRTSRSCRPCPTCARTRS